MKVLVSVATVLLAVSVAISVVSAAAGGSALSTGEATFLSSLDKTRLRNVVKLAEPLSSNDPASLYYYANVIVALDKTVPEASKICSHVQSLTDKDLDTIYFASAISKVLPNCQLDAAKYLATLQEFAKPEATVSELYKSVLALANLGKPVDSAKYSKLLLAAVKKDQTLLNSGLALQIAAKLTGNDRTAFASKIPAIIAQADEVDGRFLQYEGGLGVAASIINGVYQLSTAVNKAPALTTDQVAKFVNYFVSRKVVLSAKGASDVLDTLTMFSTNKFHIPHIVSNYGSPAVSAENPILTVKVTNVLGQSVAPVTVTGVSFTKQGEKTSALSNIAFKPVTGDSTLYAYDFFEKPLPAGVYTLVVDSALGKPDARVFANTKVQIQVNVLTQVEVSSAEFGVGDADVASKTQKLSYPSALSGVMDVDKSQRILIKFQLQDKMTKSSIDVHQAFARFVNDKTKQEVIFVAEMDSSNNYKVDLNLEIRSKDFGGLSGVYHIYLMVGDSLVMNSINWKIGSVDLQLDGVTAPASKQAAFAPRPEIKHLFREPEKRPHATISTLFTALVMVPAGALIVMWFKIGINFSAFRLSFSAIIFHVSLALIFLLYACFFVKLNMFETVKYLFGFSIVAFFSGHSLLSSLIKQNKQP